MIMCKISDQAVDAILKKGKIYEVGGVVRDRLLGGDLIIKDRDYLVTGVPYADLSRLLGNFGNVDLVGRSFGVIKFTQFRNNNKYTFDIALPRKESSTGVGHKDFEVAFDPDISINDDLLRRDFTINAMAQSLEDESLIDPYGGQIDIKSKTIRMVAENSFVEDPLRMLRAVQFAARLNFEIEKSTYDAIIQHAELIKSVSIERINEELNKMLVLSDQPSHGFRLMLETGLLEYVLPELMVMVDVDQPGGYHKYDVFEHSLHAVDAAPRRLHLRLAALLHDLAKPRTRRITPEKATFYGHEIIGAKMASKMLKRLRYSTEIINQVMVLIKRHMFTTDVTDKGMRRLIRKTGQGLIFDLLDLRRADVVAQGMGGTTEDVDVFEQNIKDEIDRKPPFGYGDLALNGDDIMAMFNIPESRMVGDILEYLMEKVLDEPNDNNRERMELFAREYYEENKDV